MSPLTTSVEALEDNKVRLKVAVPAADFEKAVDAAFRKLAREVRIPGFRPGKAPRQLLEARLGPGVAREQALRDSVPEYYAEAVAAEDIDVIAAPEIDLTAGEEDGDVEFDAVVEVRPIVTISGYDGLRVEIPSPAIEDEAVDAQIDALRERFADLEDKEGTLADGDYAQIDIKGYVHDEVIDALSATDYLYEIGSETLVPALDVELRGARAGDILKFNDTLPERLAAGRRARPAGDEAELVTPTDEGGDRAGEEVAFQVLVKGAKRKVLPDADDGWASEVSEFDTIAELREDARTRLDLYAKVQSQLLVRDKVLEAAAELVEVDSPEPLVAQEMERRLHDLHHRLEPQGVNITQYLEITGQDQEAFVANVREGATRAVKADLALRSVVEQENIEPTDADLDAEIERLAERVEEKPAKVRRDLEQRGALEAVRSEIAGGKALEHLVEHAPVVDESGNPVDLTLPQETDEADEQNDEAQEQS
jgi:trigger factor